MRPKTIAPDAVALLAAHDWRKNNVRELSNVLERMMIASDTAVITVAEVPPDIRGDDRDDADDPSAAPGTLKAMKAQAERQIVVAALEKHNWHVTKTAEALGLGRSLEPSEDHETAWIEQKLVNSQLPTPESDWEYDNQYPGRLNCHRPCESQLRQCERVRRSL